jgi:transcriptional regulator with XRE-family HTH domain
MPQTSVNVIALHAALDAARQAKDLSWRELARVMDLSPSTLSRLANGYNPDVNAFAVMVQWLKVPAEQFMVTEDDEREPRDEPDLVAQLGPLLRARKDLNQADIDHLEELIGSAVRLFKAQRANPAT